MSLPPEHPVRQFLDAVANGGRPTSADLDALLDRICNAPAPLDRPPVARDDLKAQILRSVADVGALADMGHAGPARKAVAASLPTYADLVGTDIPRPTSTESVADIVNSLEHY